MMDTEEIKHKREEEKKSMEVMVGIYCRGKHGTKKHVLCPDCRELLTYAIMRTERCPFMETKTFCSACKVHCYQPDKRTRVREVMRYAGPRMLFVEPKMAIKHVKVTLQNKKQERKKESQHVS